MTASRQIPPLPAYGRASRFLKARAPTSSLRSAAARPWTRRRRSRLSPCRTGRTTRSLRAGTRPSRFPWRMSPRRRARGARSRPIPFSPTTQNTPRRASQVPPCSRALPIWTASTCAICLLRRRSTRRWTPSRTPSRACSPETRRRSPMPSPGRACASSIRCFQRPRARSRWRSAIRCCMPPRSPA